MDFSVGANASIPLVYKSKPGWRRRQQRAFSIFHKIRGFLMSNRAYWPGKVANKSNAWVWVLFDKDGKVYAKMLAPGKKSPGDIDADAVKHTLPGGKLNGYEEWWRLKNGAEVEVYDDGGLLKLKQTSWIGELVKTKESDWGTINYDTADIAWGVKI
jgi:hypothetical protein